MRRLLLLPLFVLALAAASPAGADDHQANITATGFVPLHLTIPNGDRIVSKNNDKVNHQIVADDGSFKSDVLKPGESFAHIFVKPGTYRYHDGTKPADKGTVDVTLTREILMQIPARVVTFPKAVTLRGSVTPSTQGGRVAIQAREVGSDTFDTVATTTVESGVWQATVKPGQNIIYRAVWKNIPSAQRPVFVKPLLRMKQVGRRLFSLGAHAATSLRNHRALIQRRTRDGWRTIKVVRLKRIRSMVGSRQVIATTSFKLRLAHGTIIRALMTRAQAAPDQYGPASSRALRV
jgi:plastocyanin